MIISVFIMPKDYKIKQSIWYILSIMLFLIITKLNKNIILRSAKYIYIINILLLIYVLLFGKPINNSKSWIKFKYFSIEPNEIMKISLILIHFYILNSKYKHKLLLVIGTYLVPSFLTFLEPDTGSIVLSLVSILLFILIFNKSILIKIFGANIFYRIDRILSFTNNSSSQLLNALISIGAGKT